MDDKFIKSLQSWTVPAPKAGLAERIVAGAMVRPSLATVVSLEARRTLTEWRYGLAYKAAALAACVLIGVGIGFSHHSEDPAAADLDEVAFTVGI